MDSIMVNIGDLAVFFFSQPETCSGLQSCRSLSSTFVQVSNEMRFFTHFLRRCFANRWACCGR